MPVNFIQHFPYPTLREIQRQALDQLGQAWDKYDVFILQAPTAFGKSAISKCIMNALKSVSVITPTNLLVEQFLAEFPDTPTLSRLDSYWCEEWKRPCPVTRAKLRNFCRGGVCPCSAEMSTAKYRRGPGIYNYHTYLAHRLNRDVLICDEAHNVIPQVRERLALTIWQHDYKYPRSMYSPEQMGQWIASLPANRQRHKKIQLLAEAVRYKVPKYIVQRTTQEFNGKGTIRGQPEDRDCLKLLPVDISDAPPIFWPQEVKKIVLLSATIGPKDVEALGLGGKGRRVCYIKCASPIPAEQRPIVPICSVSVNRERMDEATNELAIEIEKIAEHHIGEKGVIHATYQLAALLRSRFGASGEFGSGNGEGASSGHSRYLFHTRENRADIYQRFRDAPPEHGTILVASGLYEGIDLPGDLGRWQVLAKIPWMSLGNPAIRHLADLDPEWYLWECAKTTIQACGRICRTPEDYGATYILDRSFWRLYKEAKHMLPDWFLEAIVHPSPS